MQHIAVATHLTSTNEKKVRLKWVTRSTKNSWESWKICWWWKLWNTSRIISIIRLQVLPVTMCSIPRSVRKFPRSYFLTHTHRNISSTVIENSRNAFKTIKALAAFKWLIFIQSSLGSPPEKGYNSDTEILSLSKNSVNVRIKILVKAYIRNNFLFNSIFKPMMTVKIRKSPQVKKFFRSDKPRMIR